MLSAPVNYCQFLVSDIGIFVLKRDVKLQLTNYCQFSSKFMFLL